MNLAKIHHLSNWTPTRLSFEDEVAAMRLDIEDLAAGLDDNHKALIRLELSVAALEAANTEILSILRGGAR